MKYQFMKDHRSSFSVQKMCRYLEVSKSGYYDYLSRGVSRRLSDEKELAEAMKKIKGNKHKKAYGAPRMVRDLKDEGYEVGKHRVARIMKKYGLQAQTPKKWKVTTNSKHSYPVAPNLVNQEFEVAEMNQLWTSDITYVWTEEGWLYGAVVFEAKNRQVIGWSSSSRMTQDLVLKAVRQALWRRKPGHGVIFHSDRGSQYAATKVQEFLKEHGFKQSMSKKGDCYDNAITESFFHTLKNEHVHFETFKTRQEAKTSLFEYIEVFYNRERRHSSLGYLSPVNYEKMLLAQAA
jgi:transposase InsO family protein